MKTALSAFLCFVSFYALFSFFVVSHYSVAGETTSEPEAFQISSLPATASDIFIWHNQSNGKTAYWGVDTAGKLVDRTQGSGWGYLDDTMTLSSAWELVGTAELNSADYLFWHNQAKGNVAWWRLNAEYTLSGRTKDAGWGYVAEARTVSSGWDCVTVDSIGGDPHLTWRNAANGKASWWRLDSTAALANLTQDSGWGYFDDELTLNSNWRLELSEEVGGTARLFWHHSGNGKVAWWGLSTAAKLLNQTQDNGWGYVSDKTLSNTWELEAFLSIESSPYLIWRHQRNGKISWWRLETSCSLLNRTQDSGWGYVSTRTLPDSWQLAGTTTFGSEPALIWQKTSNGKIAWWKLDSSCKLASLTQDNGWGYVSDTLTLRNDWRLSVILE